METQRRGKRAPSPQSGGPILVTITKRVSRLWRSGEQRSSGPPADVGWQRRLEALEDAVYRRAVLEDEKIGELRRRTDPNQLARDLNRNARRRGL
jgi:hypothetical protein